MTRTYNHSKIECSHPDRPIFCRGACKTCYQKQYYKVLDDVTKNRYNVARRERYDSGERLRKLDESYRRKFNITFKEVDEIAKGQNNLCAICLKFLPLNLDHNHKTGKIRALLCTACNLKVGVIEHELYPKILKYLEIYNG